MFLVARTFGIAREWQSGNRILYLVLSSACLSVALQAQLPRSKCLLEVPVYNADGDPLRRELLGLSAKDPQNNTLANAAVVVEAGIEFPRALIGFGLYEVKVRVHDVMVRDATGRHKGTLEFRHDVELHSCEQRTSIEWGHNDTNLDVPFATVSGKIQLRRARA